MKAISQFIPLLLIALYMLGCNDKFNPIDHGGKKDTCSSKHDSTGTPKDTCWKDTLGPQDTLNPYALHFNGSSSFTQIVDNGYLLKPKNAITVETWVKVTDTLSGNWHTMVSYGHSSTMPITSYQLGTGTGSLSSPGPGNHWVFALTIGDENSTKNVAVETVSTIRAGEWVHVAGTYDGSQLRLYVNGILSASRAYSGEIFYLPSYLRFGASSYNGSGNRYLKGDMDEVRIWNYARSAQEIAGSMRKSLGKTTSGLLGYWKFDEGSGIVTKDHTGRILAAKFFDDTYPKNPTGNTRTPGWISNTPRLEQ